MDLTQGKPEKVLLQYTLPLFGSIVFQQLYNIADSFVAGKFIGVNALAAVGNAYEITLIFLAVSFGCNMGASVVVARYFGEKNFNHVKGAVSTSYIAASVICALLTALGLLTAAPLLRLMKTPEVIFADSLLYIQIYTAGLLFLFFYNISTAVFAAFGDSKTPFYLLAFSSIANIGVDILFVKSFGMGVAGVAWATFLCQGVSAVLSNLILWFKLKKVCGKGAFSLFSLPLLKQILKIGVPSALQQSFISVGNLMIQGNINRFGPNVIAGYSAAVKFNNFAVTSFTTLGNGLSNWTAQNLGAGSSLRVRQGFAAGLKMVALISLTFSLLYLGLSKFILQLFLDPKAGNEALRVGQLFLFCVAPFYWVVAAKINADGVLRGAGKMTAFMISTCIDLVLRVVLGKVLSLFLGSTGIWLAWPISWILGTVASLLFYRNYEKKDFI